MLRVSILLIFIILSSTVYAQEIDLLIKNGHLIDPKSQVNSTMDIAIKGSKILEIAKNIAVDRAKTVVDAKGYYVSPGFIDLHVHNFFGTHPAPHPRRCILPYQ